LAFSICSGECQRQPATDDGKIELNNKSQSGEKSQVEKMRLKMQAAAGKSEKNTKTRLHQMGNL